MVRLYQKNQLKDWGRGFEAGKYDPTISSYGGEVEEVYHFARWFLL
jgi:hypothetical protein